MALKKPKHLGLGKSKIEKNSRLSHRMWTRVYMKYGWWNFIWPGMRMHSAQERASD